MSLDLKKLETEIDSFLGNETEQSLNNLFKITDNNMTTDKNGKELKVGDKVRDDYGESYAISEIISEGYVEIEELRRFQTTLSEHLIYWGTENTTPEPVERTYSRAEIHQSFKAGYKRSEYGAFDQFLKKRVPDFQEFIESINPPKI